MLPHHSDGDGVFGLDAPGSRDGDRLCAGRMGSGLSTSVQLAFIAGDRSVLPWALLQQTLFQFYLLGRLRTVIPTRSPLFAIVLTGISYAMTHLPDLTVALVTSLMGVFWTSMYYRFRMLTPIALSHAVLGTGFCYWIYDRDLLDDWLGSVW